MCGTMTYGTDDRLKSFLDTNQAARERMCRAILATDPRFSEVNPRHPSGGPDGGFDIEAKFEKTRRAMAAIGFVNGANDAVEQKKSITRKFKSDVKSAREADADADVKVFVFLTNINLTVGEKANLVEYATKAAFETVEILDRERLRIALDQPAGFFIRFQYLQIPLSEAEQASFLARYGQEVQTIVETGFQRVDDALARVTFLLESQEQLESLRFYFELDRVYAADEIGHFRAFVSIFLKEVSANIWTILFGASDLSNRMRGPDEQDFTPQIPGIGHGIGYGQWEQRLDIEKLRQDDEASDAAEIAAAALNPEQPDQTLSGAREAEDDFMKFVQHGGGGSRGGVRETKMIDVGYEILSASMPRFERGLAFRDLHQAMVMPMLNRSLADKLKVIHIFVDGYKLDEIPRDRIRFDASLYKIEMDHLFSADELADPWVRLRPASGSSNFALDFFRKTPLRLFNSPRASHSLG